MQNLTTSYHLWCCYPGPSHAHLAELYNWSSWFHNLFTPFSLLSNTSPENQFTSSSLLKTFQRFSISFRVKIQRSYVAFKVPQVWAWLIHCFFSPSLGVFVVYGPSLLFRSHQTCSCLTIFAFAILAALYTLPPRKFHKGLLHPYRSAFRYGQKGTSWPAASLSPHLYP